MPATPEDFARIGGYARMYDDDQGIDRHKCRRVVPMQVLSLGFSRTGTLSMSRALDILGYANPYHFSTFYNNVQDCDMWMEAINARYFGKGGPEFYSKEHFDKLLGHCSAVTDMPCHLFSEELINAYPESKVVLVERNEETWIASWSAFLVEATNPVVYFFSYLDPYWLGRIVAVGGTGVSIQCNGAKGLAAHKARSKDAYHAHYANVRRVAPKERLLEYKLGSGWEPLCEFLGKPVPDVPFPHINEKDAMQQSFKELVKKAAGNALRNAVILTTVVGVPAVAVWKYRDMILRK